MILCACVCRTDRDSQVNCLVCGSLQTHLQILRSRSYTALGTWTETRLNTKNTQKSALTPLQKSSCHSARVCPHWGLMTVAKDRHQGDRFPQQKNQQPLLANLFWRLSDSVFRCYWEAFFSSSYVCQFSSSCPMLYNLHIVQWPFATQGPNDFSKV